MKQIYRLYGLSFRIYRTSLLITFLLSLFFLLIALTSHAQVNAYARVTAINAARTQLTIDNRDETKHTFAANEQVIVIQMQDDVIGTNYSNNADFGKLSAIGKAGLYEVGEISTITNGRTRINLKAALSNTFTIGANSSVQVVSFTKLGAPNFITTANIPAIAWNGFIGGVVAFQVDGTLTLAHNVTADGQGFTGGGSGSGDSACAPNVFRTSSAKYGGKGEGIYLSTNDAAAAGRAPLLNGGGGGNVNNAGGAGGGNYTAGGNGGAGWTCEARPSGGMGGISLSSFLTTGARLFMGGGGGGGQGNNGTQTAGGAGGGIIIIKANVLTTSCTATSKRISANGSNASNSGGDGAGGAGAGGVIYLQVNSYTVPASCPLQLQANGGNGGNVNSADTHGGGGGGGQGAIFFANSAPNPNVGYVTAPGTGGLNSNAPDATHAGGGTGSANAGIVPIGVVLPVRIISFAAEKNDHKALLRWTAITEANTLITVQRSTDGVSFSTIGTVKATGNGNAATNYTFTDPSPAPGKNYYQLMITGDPAIQVTYSAIVPVNMSDAQNVTMAWPNPAHDHFSIRVNNEYSNKNYQVSITDLTGKLMYTNTYKPANGIITVTPAQVLKPGFYMFKVTSGGYEQAGKLMIR